MKEHLVYKGMFSRRHIAVLSITSFVCAQMPILPAFAGQIPADSLLGYWKFDETSGTSAADSSGENKTGTHQNTPTISTDVPTTSFTNARSLSFTSTSSQYVTAAAVRTNGNAAFTYSLWFKTTDSTNAYRTMLTEGRSASDVSTFHIQMPGDADGTCTVDDSLKVYMSDDSSTVATLCSSSAYNDGQWHHVAVVQSNSSSRQLYVDGTSVATNTTTLSTTTFDQVGIGVLRNTTVSQYFNGKIDDVRIYNRSLAPWEISQLAAGNHVQAFWKGAGGTGFESRRNWSGSYIPDPYSRIVVRATATGSMALTGAIKFAGLTINTGALMNLNGTGFTVNDSGTFTNYGTLALRNTETLTSFSNDTSRGTIMLAGSGSTTGMKTGNSYYNLTINDGLIGYWKLNETSGTRAVDSSGYGNSGSLINSPTITTSVAPTNFSNPAALSFDGSDDYVDLPPTLPAGQKKYSIALWFKTSTTAGSQAVWEQNSVGVTNNQRAAMLISGSNWGFNGENNDAHDKVPVRLNQWVHAVITMDTTLGTNPLKIYENGRLYWQGDTSGGASNLSMGAYRSAIGRKTSNNSEFFNGSIDDVRVYNRILSPGEVAALAAGNQPSLQQGMVTMNAAVDTNNNLILNGGTLDVSSSNYGITIGGSWMNNGGKFVARKGTVTFDGTSTGLQLLSGGLTFNTVTFNGVGATWNTRDRFTASGALTLSNGTLDASGSYVIRAGTFTQTSGTFTPRSGTVILTSGADATSIFTGTLNTLRIEDPTEEGLVGYWKFDEGTNTGAILDSVNYGNTGVRYGSGLVWTGSTLPTNISFDNPFVMKFNGLNDMVESPQSSRYELQNFTYAAWIYLSPSAGDRNAIMTYGQGTELGGSIATESAGFIYHQTSNVLRLRLDDVGNNSFIDIQKTPTTSLSGRWTHVAATWDGTTATLYMDGVSLGSSANAGTIYYTSDSLSRLRIGNWFGNNERYFKGSIDDVRVYNRALTAGEMANLYRGRYAKGSSQTATHTMGGDVTTAYLALDSGNLSTGAYDLDVTNTVSMLRGRGNLTLGSATTTIGGLLMSGATITSGAGTLDINGDVTFQTGSLIAPTGYLTLSGDWTKTGGYFTANGGTFLLDGTSQSLSGTGTFFNLQKSVTSSASLTFGAGETFTIENNLTLNGTSSNPLLLRSSTTGVEWLLNPLGGRGVQYVDVQDSRNIHALFIDCEDAGCVDSGNNTRWIFGTTSDESSNAGGNGGNGGFRGKGTALISALQARADLETSYNQTVVRDDESSSSSSSIQNTNISPVIERQRNRVVLVAGDTHLIYKDVIADAWYAPYVSNIIQDGVARGYKDTNGNLIGEFGVAKAITKAEILKMALEASDKDTVKAPAPRNKSAQDSWASPYVGIAESLALTGYSPTTDINKPATRGEVIQLIMETLDITIGTVPANYSDVPKDHPNSHAIAAATFFGLVIGDTKADGTPLNTFRPNDPINRAEASKLIALARKLKKLGGIAPPAVGGIEMPAPSSSESSITLSVSSASVSSSTPSSIAPSVAPTSQYTQAKVISQRLNIRADSRVEAYKVATIYNGQTVTVLWTQKNGWSYIRTSYGKEGYVISEFLEPIK